MNYSLEMITTAAQCDALLALAEEDKENLERRRRNLDESIGNFGERTHEYGTELVGGGGGEKKSVAITIRLTLGLSNQ